MVWLHLISPILISLINHGSYRKVLTSLGMVDVKALTYWQTSLKKLLNHSWEKSKCHYIRLTIVLNCNAKFQKYLLQESLLEWILRHIENVYLIDLGTHYTIMSVRVHFYSLDTRKSCYIGQLTYASLILYNTNIAWLANSGGSLPF